MLPVVDRGVDGLRIGVGRRAGRRATGFQPEVLDAVDQAARALEKAGATVDRVSVPSARYGLSAYYVIAPAEASSNLARYDGVRYGLRVDGDDVATMNARTRDAGFGAEVKRRIMLGTYALSAGYYDAFYGQAQRVRTLIIRDFARAYEQYDVLLSPTSPTVAFELGAKSADPLAMYLSDVCTIPTNLAGHAAISVPYGIGEGGLPIGVQVLAPALGEAVMFRVARVLEESRVTATTRDYEPVIGLEVHCELSTATKLFCGCPNEFGAEPNTNVCPVCLGLPGSLPVLNEQTVEFALRFAEAVQPAGARAVDVLPQELLLSRHAEGLPGLAVRRADHRSTAGSTSTARASASSARTSRRTPARPRTSVAVVASTRPTTRSSTTTAPASR